jgi:hypothetical protein
MNQEPGMNRRMMSVLAVAAAGLAASIYRNRRIRRAALAPRESTAERTRWEGEGGTVAPRPVDTPTDATAAQTAVS